MQNQILQHVYDGYSNTNDHTIFTDSWQICFSYVTVI